jgi:hypothetical protein
MQNDAFPRRDAGSAASDHELTGFLDTKGIEWRVAWRDLPERRGRIALDFASANGKRRSAEVKATQLDELQCLSQQAWQTMLANAAVIELE